MKQPTADQLEQLTRLRQYRHAVEYMQTLESEYIKRLIGCDETVTLHRLQGSIDTVQTLLKHIHSDMR